jgi:radical SAM superfamily enzyme YgiQ (UPF0313 family)
MDFYTPKKTVRGGKKEILLLPPILNPFSSSGMQSFMPLGLLALVATLRDKGFNPRIYKPWKRLIKTEDYQVVAKDILNKNPLIVGFSTWCINYPASLLIAREIKSVKPEIPLIFGGPQATLVGKETLHEFNFIDYILTGEADLTFPQLVELLLNDSDVREMQTIPGLMYRAERGKITINKAGNMVINLDDLPIPAYDLVSTSKSLKLDVGRGCPFRCTFCRTNNFFSKKYRTKSSERTLNEMNLLWEKYGIHRFSFAHDMFTLNKSSIFELCNSLIYNKKIVNKSFTWTCSARIDCVSEDLLEKMNEAGCQSVFFGIESGSEKIQKSISKNLKTEDAYKVADICREIGIDMHASFIIGFPDETEDDIEKTLFCLLNLALRGAYVQISELSVLPGTSLFDQFKEQLKFDGKYSNFSECFCSSSEISLIRKHPEIFSSFYYLPVNSIDRNLMHVLCSLINYSGDFRNTLFLLADHIQKNLKQNQLLKLFHDNYRNLSTHVNSGLPVVSWLSAIIGNYLEKFGSENIRPYIFDVYVYEATRSSLIARFARLHLINPANETDFQRKQGNDETKKLIQIPIWQIIRTSYNLKSILPSQNGWKKGKLSIRKGDYRYILIATSEKKCKLVKINAPDFNFLKDHPDEILTSENFKPGRLKTTRVKPEFNRYAENHEII